MSGRRERIEAALLRLAPRIPGHERGAVIDHALDSPGLKTARPESAAWLSLVSYVRHVFTDYDDLLADGYDVDSARFFVAGDIDDVLVEWGCARSVNDEET
ncbi:hypothetical protein C882_4421 [Caenispirillum salinarum AK4]|uniref:DUF2293 domain-containing protein n=1 Tax=Caenispirillum salinarum AK4 TaxID=1238182 RepID=K9GYT8_9PROT|nr:DUF2293 domain-containing protein [Caenispirillum salinarum]EKV30462.1 hypothetical protein C882_4421 [Caenispirillum salinarum AK4]